MVGEPVDEGFNPANIHFTVTVEEYNVLSSGMRSTDIPGTNESLKMLSFALIIPLLTTSLEEKSIKNF